jgi:DNA-binding NarL/FixJ family response regulator
MTYWDLILKEIMQKKDDPTATYQFIHRKTKGSKAAMSENTKPTTPRKRYLLGDKYPNIAFSYQEAECMRQALKGKTIPGIAAALELSPRTVEYYFQKMRLKLKCHTKSELVEKVLESDFVKVAQVV